MADALKDILSNLNSNNTEQEKLLQYLNGELAGEQLHELEKHLIDDEFESAALEGFEEMKDQQQLTYIVDQLNRDLHKKTAKRKAQKDKTTLKPQWWLYFSILTLLIIIILIYLYLHQSINS